MDSRVCVSIGRYCVTEGIKTAFLILYLAYIPLYILSTRSYVSFMHSWWQWPYHLFAVDANLGMTAQQGFLWSTYISTFYLFKGAL